MVCANATQTTQRYLRARYCAGIPVQVAFVPGRIKIWDNAGKDGTERSKQMIKGAQREGYIEVAETEQEM